MTWQDGTAMAGPIRAGGVGGNARFAKFYCVAPVNNRQNTGSRWYGGLGNSPAARIVESATTIKNVKQTGAVHATSPRADRV